MSIVTRAATASDAAAIATVGARSFTWAFGHLFTPEVLERYLDATYAESKIRSSLAKPENLFFVADADRTVGGFLKLKRGCPHPTLEGRQWQLQKLYVDPGRIRSGLGFALMAAGEHAMRAEGVETVWLLVYAGNERAQAFYRRYDYREAGSEVHDFEHIRVVFKLLVKRLAVEPTPL